MGKERLTVMTASVILVIMILGLSSWLNYSSFRKNYTESLAAGYGVLGGEARRNMEYALKYGKPLENFYGMNRLLKEVADRAPELDNIRILDRTGRELYGLAEGEEIPLSESERRNARFDGNGAKQSYRLFYDQEKYHMYMPLRDRTQQWVGTMEMTFGRQVVDQHTAEGFGQGIRVMGGIGAGAILLLVLCLAGMNLWDTQGQVRKKKLMALLLTVIGGAQILFCAESLHSFQGIYLAMAKENTILAARIIQEDVDSVLGKGVRYDQISDVRPWLDKIVENVPEIQQVCLSDGTGREVFSSSPPKAGDDEAGWMEKMMIYREKSFYQYQLPMEFAGGKGTLRLDLELSKSRIGQKMGELMLDGLTLLVVSVFFTVEVVLFLLTVLHRSGKKNEEPGGETLPATAGADAAGGALSLIRPLAFIFYLAYFIPIAFIPMQMEQLYQPIAGLPKSVVLGLPVSAEIFCTAAAVLAAGYLLDHRGWPLPLTAGMGLFAIGAFLSGWADSAVSYIIGRGVAGFGYGFIWIALRGFVADGPEDSRISGFSSLNAGIFAANICGGVIGSMLADRMGFSRVFYLTVLVALLAGVVYWAVLRRAAHSARGRGTSSAGPGKMAAFFQNGRVLSFYLLAVIPSAACLVGFLQYYFPVYASHSGSATANVGRGFMLYGICMVYVGPMLLRGLRQYVSIERILVLSLLLAAGALAMFSRHDSLQAAFVTLFIMGVADSVGFVAQNAYYLKLEAVSTIGDGKALGFYSMVWKIGQMLGPLLFGWLSVAGPAVAIGTAGLGYALLAVLFALYNRQVIWKDAAKG